MVSQKPVRAVVKKTGCSGFDTAYIDEGAGGIHRGAARNRPVLPAWTYVDTVADACIVWPILASR